MTKRVLDMAATSFDDLPNDALRVIFQWLSQDSGSDAVYTTVQLAGTRCYFSDLADVVRITTPDEFNDGAMYYNGNVWLPSLVCRRFRAISKEIRRDWYRANDLLDNDVRCSVMKVMVYNVFGPGKHCLYTFQASAGWSLLSCGSVPFFGVSLYIGPEKGHVQVMSNLSVEKHDYYTSYNKAYFAVFHAVRRYLFTGNSQNMALNNKLSYKQSQALSCRSAVYGFISNKLDS